MNNQTLEAWQRLHGRVVAGEVLSAEEIGQYEAGCNELDSSEKLDGGLARLRELRLQIVESDSEKMRLRERESEMDARIAELEARLDARTRQLLGIGN